MFSSLGISVKRMLDLDVLNHSEILAGYNGLERKVKKVNVMEVPDILNWVSEGEFLITAAYSIKDNVKVLGELIPKLDEKGVAGLGIKVGRYISELPENIINLANDLCFPIIQIPFNVSHTDIISNVLTEVIDDQMKMIIKIDEFNNEIMDIMIKGGSLKEIAKKLYDHIGNTLAIYENIYDTCEIISTENNVDAIEEVVQSDFKKFYINNNINDMEKDLISSEDRIMLPIIIDNIVYGGLFIWMDNKKLLPIDIMIIKSYVHIIALDFVKKMSLLKVESNYKLEFFDDILSADSSRQKKALEKHKIFSFDKELKYSSIIISIKEVQKYKVKSTREIVNNLVFIIGRLSKNRINKILYVEKNDKILILYGCSRYKSNKEIKDELLAFCKQILLEVRRSSVDWEIIIGIGRSYDKISLLSKSYEESSWVITNFKTKESNTIVHFDDIGVFRILCNAAIQPELESFCAETIDPLVQYDKENNSQLVETLKEYFKCDGNMKKLSQRMYLHYNTILYRLQKIRDISGIDIEDSDGRLKLHLALKVKEIL